MDGCPGKILSIIKFSISLSVTAKQEFSHFFAGIANYRKPAADKRRAFHDDESTTKLIIENSDYFDPN